MGTGPMEREKGAVWADLGKGESPWPTVSTPPSPIGGPVPAGHLEDLLDAIEGERLRRDWEEPFQDRGDLLAYLEDGA